MVTTNTFGFDMESGETIPLGSVPPALPTELPSPEEPGSKKALVHSTPSARDEDSEDDELDVATSTLETASTTLVTPVNDDVVVAASTTTTPVVFDDVVVPPRATSTSSADEAVAHIPDVIISAANGTSTTYVDE